MDEIFPSWEISPLQGLVSAIQGSESISAKELSHISNRSHRHLLREILTRVAPNTATINDWVAATSAKGPHISLRHEQGLSVRKRKERTDFPRQHLCCHVAKLSDGQFPEGIASTPNLSKGVTARATKGQCSQCSTTLIQHHSCFSIKCEIPPNPDILSQSKKVQRTRSNIPSDTPPQHLLVLSMRLCPPAIYPTFP